MERNDNDVVCSARARARVREMFGIVLTYCYCCCFHDYCHFHSRVVVDLYQIKKCELFLFSELYPSCHGP